MTSQTHQATPSVTTHTRRRSSASSHAPSCTDIPIAHGAPNGVQESTPTTWSSIAETSAAVMPLPSNCCATVPIIGPIITIGISATTISTSRERRESSSGTSAVVSAREPTTHSATASAAPINANGITHGVRHQAKATPAAANSVAAPGIEVSPAAASPASNDRRGMPKVTNRCGSSVASVPKANTGTTSQARMTREPITTIT